VIVGMRPLACCAIALTVAIGAHGQDAAFAVASIKLNTSGLPYSQSTDSPNGVALVNERLRDVILFAYGLYEFQLTGDPAWVSRDRFDITARADGPLSFDETRARVRRLLADRFALKVRTETREQSVYALVKSGPDAGAGLKGRDCAVPGIGGLACGRGIASPDGGVMRMGGIPMARLAGFLGGVLGRVVLDETGLTGPFDVDLQWRPDIGLSPDLTEAAKQRIEARATLPVAVREQLGLELQSRRSPVTLVVVESIAPPTSD
jgi:bla regulator protein blaR1